MQRIEHFPLLKIIFWILTLIPCEIRYCLASDYSSLNDEVDLELSPPSHYMSWQDFKALSKSNASKIREIALNAAHSKLSSMEFYEGTNLKLPKTPPITSKTIELLGWVDSIDQPYIVVDRNIVFFNSNYMLKAHFDGDGWRLLHASVYRWRYKKIITRDDLQVGEPLEAGSWRIGVRSISLNNNEILQFISEKQNEKNQFKAYFKKGDTQFVANNLICPNYKIISSADTQVAVVPQCACSDKTNTCDNYIHFFDRAKNLWWESPTRYSSDWVVDALPATAGYFLVVCGKKLITDSGLGIYLYLNDFFRFERQHFYGDFHWGGLRTACLFSTHLKAYIDCKDIPEETSYSVTIDGVNKQRYNLPYDTYKYYPTETDEVDVNIVSESKIEIKKGKSDGNYYTYLRIGGESFRTIEPDGYLSKSSGEQHVGYELLARSNYQAVYWKLFPRLTNSYKAGQLRNLFYMERCQNGYPSYALPLQNKPDQNIQATIGSDGSVFIWQEDKQLNLNLIQKIQRGTLCKLKRPAISENEMTDPNAYLNRLGLKNYKTSYDDALLHMKKLGFKLMSRDEQFKTFPGSLNGLSCNNLVWERCFAEFSRNMGNEENVVLTFEKQKDIWLLTGYF